MDLTPRQQLFLDKLYDLYRETGGPAHYSAVAERLGVNKFSAYDMLKLLEEKGVVASTYALKDEHSGPGRSMVVFYPTREAIQYLTQLKYEVFSLDEWYQFKESFLQKLRQTQDSGYAKATREILAHLPDVKTPLSYCTQMVGVLLLNLAQVSRQADQNAIYRRLKCLVAEGEIGLGTLAGFSLGSLLSSQSADDASLADKLTSHTRQFQDQLGQLSEESIRRLNSFLKDAIVLFERAS
jgi:DNA-binding MarR family transcriptional regulator